MNDPNLAIVADGLRKRYRDTIALAGCDLTVPAGTVHGLLGPNGAGKTTAVQIFTTLLRPDHGHAQVAGYDVVRQAAQVRYRIGLVGQQAALDERLSGRQNLVMFGRLYHLPAAAAVRRADELLARFRLADTGRKPVKQYSGGMRRRLDLAASLILSPPVLFLDEPTTGLDPRSRNEVWQAVRGLVADGTTVLLTTQYLDEANQLADHISVLDHGRVIADGTPEQLKRQFGADRVDLVLARAEDLPTAAAALARLSGAEPTIDPDRRQISVEVTDRLAVLTALLPELATAGVVVEDMALRRPTLDEVFMHLTGDSFGGEQAGAAQPTTEVEAA